MRCAVTVPNRAFAKVYTSRNGESTDMIKDIRELGEIGATENMVIIK